MILRSSADMASPDIEAMLQTIKDNMATSQTTMCERIDNVELNLKQYINDAVFAFIDKLITHLSTNTNSAAPTVRDNKQDTTDQPHIPSATHTTSATTTTIESNQASLTTPPPGKLRATMTTGAEVSNQAGQQHVKHDVYIGNMSSNTTERDVRDHLTDIGVKEIQDVTKQSESDSSSCSFRVSISDDTIKHNVFNRDNFDAGIIVKPYRYHITAANSNTNNANYHNPVDRRNNRVRQRDDSYQYNRYSRGYTAPRHNQYTRDYTRQREESSRHPHRDYDHDRYYDRTEHQHYSDRDSYSYNDRHANRSESQRYAGRDSYTYNNNRHDNATESHRYHNRDSNNSDRLNDHNEHVQREQPAIVPYNTVQSGIYSQPLYNQTQQPQTAQTYYGHQPQAQVNQWPSLPNTTNEQYNQSQITQQGIVHVAPPNTINNQQHV